MAMATPADSSIPPAEAPIRLPSNPTPLSAPQEQQVRDLYYKNVRAKCAAEIAAFATCATGRTFTMIYACRPQKLAMNTCMLQYQGQDELDKARAEWFALAGERRREKEERARLVEESKKRHKDWWGLDEKGRLQGKRLEEKLERDKEEGR
ncbi:uncharacterized protein N0V89_002661 [Didymosphaeria variabile]|uniref:COX assembly mitochondrial protein n=1 Tax=Didymosphaeria variabile TaxID=1932322 RepID=A0A9W8XV77_9PLEO|nr:uncharacterized protein N0V89_002661 [Didymosphaeria variabile]KAJ4358082.1 hypothetical protein N0V89_002661 [Didymosphaeria variabile]